MTPRRVIKGIAAHLLLQITARNVPDPFTNEHSKFHQVFDSIADARFSSECKTELLHLIGAPVPVQWIDTYWYRGAEARTRYQRLQLLANLTD